MIEEEGLLDDGERDRGVPRRYYVLDLIVGFFILFGLFSLILYGAAKPQKPKITVKSITSETLKIQAGQDAGGVGTDMITMNATLECFDLGKHRSYSGTYITSVKHQERTTFSEPSLTKIILPLQGCRSWQRI